MADKTEIKTMEPEDNDDTERKACGFCLKAEAKYTCPRCNSPYCSVDCYRSEKHLNCSESFYKDCFMEGLKECNADPSEKKKVMEMLKRAEADPDLNDLDFDEDDLHERLSDLDLERDIDKVWDRLTDQEKREFEAMTGDGRLGNLVEVWTPWWTKSQLPLVTEVKVTPPSNEPKIVTDIPNISQLLKTKPSADVKYNVLNLLYAYVFVSRLHNGDHVSMATESVQDLLEVSEVMGQGHSCGSVEESIQLCLGRVINPLNSFESTPEWNISMIKDVEQIINGRKDSGDPLHFILCAMSDIYYILKGAQKSVSKQLKKGLNAENMKKLTEEKKKLFHCVKKCEFLLSWCQTYGMALIGLVPEIQIVYALLTSEYESVNQSKKSLETAWGGQIRPKKKPLIEEINDAK